MWGWCYAVGCVVLRGEVLCGGAMTARAAQTQPRHVVMSVSSVNNRKICHKCRILYFRNVSLLRRFVERGILIS